MTSSTHSIGTHTKNQPIEKRSDKTSSSYFGRFINIKNRSAKVLLIAFCILSKIATVKAQNDTYCSSTLANRIWLIESNSDAIIPLAIMSTIAIFSFVFCCFGFSCCQAHNTYKTIKKHEEKDQNLDQKFDNPESLDNTVELDSKQGDE